MVVSIVYLVIDFMVSITGLGIFCAKSEDSHFAASNKLLSYVSHLSLYPSDVPKKDQTFKYIIHFSAQENSEALCFHQVIRYNSNTSFALKFLLSKYSLNFHSNLVSHKKKSFLIVSNIHFPNTLNCSMNSLSFGDEYELSNVVLKFSLVILELVSHTI
jgi:hypothetical protein